MKEKAEPKKLLKIGIVGFGTFGQFIAKRLVQQGHSVLATSRTPYLQEAQSLGVEFYTDSNDFCEEHPDVVVLASSILSTSQVLTSLPLQRLRRSTLFVDVLSVKVFPKQLLLSLLPPEMDILCTHPMFGPDSGKGAWDGLNFMYERVRVGEDAPREARCEAFLSAFRREGCRMVEMTCEEHDRQAASTQFITHTVGRVLGAMELRSTEIDTKGYEALLKLVNNTANDSFDLYYGLFLYNQNATDELEKLDRAFDQVKKQLFGRLHDIVRSQLLPPAPPPPASPPSSTLSSPRSTSPPPAPFLPSPPPSPKSATTAGGAGASPTATTPASEALQQTTPQQQRQQQLQTVTAAAAAASPLASAATSTAADSASASNSGSSKGSDSGSGGGALQPGGVVTNQPALERQLSSMAAELLSVQQQAEAPAPLAQSARERVRR